jgi:hypothetical protein
VIVTFHHHTLLYPPRDTDAFAPMWIASSEAAEAAAGLKPCGHPVFDRMMAKIPHPLQATFTPEQLAALAQASVPVNTAHVIDYRVSFPFFGKRFYVTLLAGRERRSLSRLAAEGQIRMAQITTLYATFLGLGLAAMLIAVVMVLYFVKAVLGLDFFEGESALHDMLGW